jgi:hypothetical protein
MTKVKSFTLPVLMVLGSFLLSSPQAVAQTQEEFEAELTQYASDHTQNEVIEYVENRVASLTTQAYFEDFAELQLLGWFIDQSQCMRVKRQICDNAFSQKLLEITAVSTAAIAACAVTSGVITPPGTIICFAAVLIQHGARLRAARLEHKNCYLQARLDCAGAAVACVVQQFIAAHCDDYDYESCICTGGYNPSPIVIDIVGNGLRLTDANGGVGFDISNTGIIDQLGWTRPGSDDAFLVLDRNGNGQIDNGAELFGNYSPQPAPLDGSEKNGFWALTGFDKNGDGKISRLDAIFSSLRLWQDVNHNGISELPELHTLPELGLKSIDLDYKRSRRVDSFGNEFRFRAKVKDNQDAQLGRWAWDVFLVHN